MFMVNVGTWILRLGLKFEPRKNPSKTDRLGLKFDTQTEGLGKYIPNMDPMGISSPQRVGNLRSRMLLIRVVFSYTKWAPFKT